MAQKFICPVCGYPELDEQPHGLTTGGSYEICPSCGFQFGVSDEDRGYTYEQWRKEWLGKGQPWSSVGVEQPANWDPQEQLESLFRSIYEPT